MEIKHLNCGWLHAPPLPPASCHCLLLYDGQNAVLVDAGIGTQDIASPEERIGRQAIERMGFQFIPEVTAKNQLEQLGLSAEAVTDIVVTHCDADHVGGLADFPAAKVHLSAEEMANVDAQNPRYCPAQFSHSPRWTTYDRDDSELFGLSTRRVDVPLGIDMRLVPLFGHTLGHCGVAIGENNSWTLHVGDAYYLRDELTNYAHPIDELATLAADDNQLRRKSLGRLRTLASDSEVKISLCGYHDRGELPEGTPQLHELV